MMRLTILTACCTFTFLGCAPFQIHADAGCADVVGTMDTSACDDRYAPSEFVRCCQEHGGKTGGGCTSASCNRNTNVKCYAAAPVPPAAGTFSCGVLNCSTEQVCVIPNWMGDACIYPACVVPDAPCTSTPTCGCIAVNHLFQGAPCSQDDAGHASVTVGN